MNEESFSLKRFFRVKRPCGNCPFLKVGAIALRPGRLEEIAAHLHADDSHSFSCHETLGAVPDDDGDEGPCENHVVTETEAHCAGAAIFLEKKGRSSMWMRIGYAMGDLKRPDLLAQAHKIIDDVSEAQVDE